MILALWIFGAVCISSLLSSFITLQRSSRKCVILESELRSAEEKVVAREERLLEERGNLVKKTEENQ
ncbi:MAG: hypothetical protein ABIR96_07735, partial [Bdellovibrionota bacterium]